MFSSKNCTVSMQVSGYGINQVHIVYWEYVTGPNRKTTLRRKNQATNVQLFILGFWFCFVRSNYSLYSRHKEAIELHSCCSCIDLQAVTVARRTVTVHRATVTACKSSYCMRIEPCSTLTLLSHPSFQGRLGNTVVDVITVPGRSVSN